MFGAPIVVDNNIPASGSGVAEIAYGSSRRATRSTTPACVSRCRSIATFEVDQVAYRLIMRLDGAVQDPSAYGLYQRTS